MVCNNTLNLALSSAKRTWAARHTGDLQMKLAEAHRCLDMAGKYMEQLGVYADQLANTTVTDAEIQKFLNELFPLKEDASDREKNNIKTIKDEYMVCWFAPDLLKFRNFGWGAINAMSDMISHNAPRRQTQNYRENNWGRIMDGHVLMDKLTAMVAAKV